ncbi:MAG: hypothetical protein ABL903_07785 [Methylococcales bacterium]
MHDIDRTQLEYSPELENYEYEQYEYGETEWGAETGVFSEAQTMELAAELLEVGSEAELDRFLGDLIRKAGQAAGQFIKSPVGQQLGGLLKGAAKKALPMVGSAVGGYFGGSGGAKIGSQVASTAGRIFGLELEGLSLEDQEFEAAKSFVQFAGEAVKNAASAPQTTNPKAIAQQAATTAARQLAPGLLSGATATPTAATGGRACTACGRAANSGRWFRRGSKIVLLGA